FSSKTRFVTQTIDLLERPDGIGTVNTDTPRLTLVPFAFAKNNDRFELTEIAIPEMRFVAYGTLRHMRSTVIADEVNEPSVAFNTLVTGLSIVARVLPIFDLSPPALVTKLMG
ncbi:hypothetical protein, partial [Stenotrophomonas maltophilia]|uniref:hypothetical protein n=1 Tax=Stenotrophomonas maltophilia TaxID=40324 RepID=UPI0013D9879A